MLFRSSPSAAAAASTAEAAAAPLCVGVVTRVLTVAEADLRQAPNKKPQSGGGGGEAGYALLKFADGRRVAIALDGGAGSSIGVFGGQSGCSGGGSCNDRGIRVCEGCAGCTTQDALAGVSSAISTAPLARLRSALRVGNVVALSPDAEPCGEDHEAAAADKLWAWCVDGKAERFDRGTVHVVAASTAPTEAGCEDGTPRGLRPRPRAAFVTLAALAASSGAAERHQRWLAAVPVGRRPRWHRRLPPDWVPQEKPRLRR